MVLLTASLAGAGALVLGWTDLGLRSIQRGRSGSIPLSLPSLGSRVSLPLARSRGLDIAGLTPEITPIGDFYVVDQAIENPVLDASSWRLSLEGSVRRPYSLTYAQLKALPTVERYQSLECVGEPGGWKPHLHHKVGGRAAPGAARPGRGLTRGPGGGVSSGRTEPSGVR